MQEKNDSNKSKPKNNKDKEKEANLNNIYKMNLNVNNNNNNLITKKNWENEKNNKNIKKNLELDCKNNLIFKTTNTKNNPNDNLGLLKEKKNLNSNLNSNNKLKSKVIVNNFQFDQNQRKNYNNENENKKKKRYNEEGAILDEEELMIKENNNFCNEEKHNNSHNRMLKTENSLYSYVNRSTQLDYFHELLNYIKSEKTNSNKIINLSKNKTASCSNINNERKNTAIKNTLAIKEKRFKFKFDVAIRLTLNKFYNLYPAELNKIVVENLIFNKNCHMVSVFKDHMIFDYVDEFLKRFYFHEESKERIPKISNYYKNYLKFFCNPIFRDFKINNIIQGYGDYKAEMYYNRNYGNKGNNDNGINYNFNRTRKRQIEENSELKKIFDTNAKINIDRNSIMSCSNMSIKQQIFNESNFQYYIDKIQINKLKEVNNYDQKSRLDEDRNFTDKRKTYSPTNKKDFTNFDNSKYTNTLLEFSQYNLNNYCLTNNDYDDSRRLIHNNNSENSNFVIDNFKDDDISHIMQYKDLQKILKEQGKNFEKENKLIINKNLLSGINGIVNSKKDVIKVNKDINENIILNNLDKILKNNPINKRNSNSKFNEYESKTMFKKSNENLHKYENLYTNRSNEESILSLINIIDLKNNDNFPKEVNLYKQNDDCRFKEKMTQYQTTMRQSNILEDVDNIKETNFKTNTNNLNSHASNNGFLKNNEKNIIQNFESNRSSSNKNNNENISNNNKILPKGLNNDNPYIIKKTDLKEKRISIEYNSVLNKLNFKNIDSNSNSKSNSKTFTDPNNNSNNAYLGLNTSKTLTNNNKSNYTNNSTINTKSHNQHNEKSILKRSENQSKDFFKPKINSVEIVKSNFSGKNCDSKAKQEKTEKNNNYIENDYYQSGVENHKKAMSKYIEKSNVQLIERELTINLLNKNNIKIDDDSMHLINKKNNNKNFENKSSYKTQEKNKIIADPNRFDSKNNQNSNCKDSVSNSLSKDKAFEKKLFSTLDPSNLQQKSQSKFNLLSPTDNKNNLIANSKLNTKNIIISNNKYSIKKGDNEARNSDIAINAINSKFSPSNKNGMSSFKANNNIINYNLYNKSLNSNNFEAKKLNLATNKNSDDTMNTYTKSAEIRANNNFINPSTKTSDIETVSFNQAQEQSKSRLLSGNPPPQITLNYKINSRNHNQNNQVIKITNSNSNNMGTGHDNNSSNVNFKSENYINKFFIVNSNIKNSETKFSTTKIPINMTNTFQEGNSHNNFMINSSVYNNNNLNMTDKIKNVLNTYSKNIDGNTDKNAILSESKHQQNNYTSSNNKEVKRLNDSKQKLIKKASNNSSNKAFNSLNNNYANQMNKNINHNHHNNNQNHHLHIENCKSENSNLHNMELISDEKLENFNANELNEIKNSILINNPNIISKPNALTDIMKITLSFYMDKSNSRNNRPTSNTSAHNSANNIINNQHASIGALNENQKKTTIINKIENLNKFNININNQFNLGNLNSINPNQLQQINNITNLNPAIFINNTSDNTKSNGNINNKMNNGILEYNSKKKSQSKAITNKTIDTNNNNQLNHNSNNNLSNNISYTTHSGKLLKFNEKSHIEGMNKNGFPISENKNYTNYSENYNFKNQESSCMSTNNKFNKSSNQDNAYFNIDKKAHIRIDDSQNINNNRISKKEGNTNSNIIDNNKINNNNIINSNLKLTFSQDTNTLKNIIEKNKVLSRNKNDNLFKISSNQNSTKPGIISEEDLANNKDLNEKTIYNNGNYPNTIFNLNSANNNSSVFLNDNKIKNFSDKSDMNLLNKNQIQMKAFNSYAHKGKLLIFKIKIIFLNK